MITPAKKKYLFIIYEISLQKTIIRSVDIAKAINISKASVCKMLSFLAEDGLIEKSSDRAITLTVEGKIIAEKFYGLYKSLYRFFTEFFQSSLISAREDAVMCICNLTDENTENLKKYFFENKI